MSQGFEEELLHLKRMGGKSIGRLEASESVLIVNWRSERLCERESHMIDWLINTRLPIIKSTYRFVLHRADGDIMREVAA